jgi:hypothetical protein
MANICENRLEIVFESIAAETEWKARYLSIEHGKQWLDITLGESDSEDQQSFAKITDEDRGDNNSLILYCDSRWAPPTEFFTYMVESNPAFIAASLEYAEPNMAFIGSVEWDKETKNLSETHRSGIDLTDDDWHILGHEKCDECSKFTCECG